MAEQKQIPYGSWRSPISADVVVAKSIRLGQIALDGEDIYWLEMRPEEGGRNVLVRRTIDGRNADVTHDPFNVRTRVHEYGGGAFAVHHGVIYFANFSDQRIYRHTFDEQPEPITPEGARRYADFIFDANRECLISVSEDHGPGEQDAENSIVRIEPGAANPIQTLVAGHDFYAAPRLSPDGTKLAWLAWNHPDMPWDTAELWVADLDETATLDQPRKIAGGSSESTFQPEWSPDGQLYFVSDRTGWWNLFALGEEGIRQVTHRQAEFGLPLWMFGFSTYAFASQQRIVATYFENGQWHLASIDTHSREFQEIDLPYTDIEYVRAREGQVVFNASSPTHASAVVRIDLHSEAVEVLRESSPVAVDSNYLSTPEAVEFATENGLTAHAYFYPPKNPDFRTPEGELPPVIVKSHGGPTGATCTALDLKIQFWTSRGIAILDVNYGGSTGYGREYRERLHGTWGITDVDDCMNAAKYLAEQGRIDPERTAIAGGSAGGFTTLAALTFRDFFKAGASYYGVSDLEALVRDTHKFESRYLDRLIGAYPERQDLYEERSPVHHVEKLACPIILLQGAEDKVVPPNQAEMMFQAIKKKKLPVAYILFEDEQHGFRKAENIKRALEAELYFYSRIFGFEPADAIEPISIENHPDAE